MRGLVIVLIVLVIIASFSFVAVSINSDIKDEKVETQEEHKNLEFSTFTSAVCEDKKDLVYCKDEVFINCNGEITKANGFVECNGIKLDVPKATGSAVFGKDWKDPRN